LFREECDTIQTGSVNYCNSSYFMVVFKDKEGNARFLV
jgi:hypothetical protein